MRVNLIILLLITTLLQVSAATFAQKVTLKENGLTMERMFKEIRKQTGYNVIMDNSKLIKSRINANFDDTPINEVMNFLVKGTDFTFTIEDKVIVIKEKTLLDKFSTVISNMVRDLNVKGRVTDQDGKPLPNASIRVKGKSAVTNTNSEGEFELKGVDENAVLQVSYVGFKTLEIPLQGAVLPLEIKLNVATGELEEVKVVYNTGYQELNKERATGSFVQIDNELFNRSVSQNVIERIYNVTNGLSFTNSAKNSSGVPTLLIRGKNTINAPSAPLIVIDNFPYEGSVENLKLNPDDVENITVLRDAAAAAIWGIRAGNGVIVITTKKGKYNQSNKVSLTTNLTLVKKPDLFYIPSISSADMIAFEKKSFASELYNDFDDFFPAIGYFPVLPEAVEILLAARKGKISKEEADVKLTTLEGNDIRNDINKYILQNAINRQYAFNISGGGNAYNYFGSISYMDNKPNDVKSNKQDLSMRFNNTWKPIQNLEISAQIEYIKSNSKSGSGNYSTYFSRTGNQISPYTRLSDENGNANAIPRSYRTAYIDTAKYPALLDWHYKPLDELNETTTKIKSNSIRINTSINYNILPGLNATLIYQYQKAISDNNLYSSPNSFAVRNSVNTFMNIAGGKVIYPYPLGSTFILSNTEQNNWNLRGKLSYDKQFHNHTISLQIGSEIRQSKQDTKSTQIIGYNEQTGQSPVIDNTTNFSTRPRGIMQTLGVSPPGLSNQLSRNGSYFALGTYTFMNRYVVTGSGRIDQANFLGVKANDRKVPLWSVGGAWEVSKEDFYKISWLPIFKVRMTYGYQGNANAGITVLPTITYAQNTTTGATESRIASPPLSSLRWEKSRTINLATDFSIENGRISGTLDFYWKKGTDLIQGVPPEPTAGITSYNANFANLAGRGIDIQLNSLNVIGQFKLRSTLNFSFNENKVTSYKLTIPLNGLNYGHSTVIEGESLYQIRSFRWAGLDPLTGTPLIMINGAPSSYTNLSNAKLSDMVYQGTIVPKFAGNFLNSFNWKQIFLSFNISYKFGYSFRRSSNDYNLSLMDYWGWGGGHSDYTLRWQKPGDELTTNVPALIYNSTLNLAYANSNILVEKGDHIRLKDLQIGYDLNKQLISKLPFQNLRISLQATNLGILWKANKHGIDPEAYSFGAMPDQKTFSLSINANF